MQKIICKVKSSWHVIIRYALKYVLYCNILSMVYVYCVLLCSFILSSLYHPSYDEHHHLVRSGTLVCIHHGLSEWSPLHPQCPVVGVDSTAQFQEWHSRSPLACLRPADAIGAQAEVSEKSTFIWCKHHGHDSFLPIFQLVADLQWTGTYQMEVQLLHPHQIWI